jgi:MFS superfamily sulfate permease-like transporter
MRDAPARLYRARHLLWACVFSGVRFVNLATILLVVLVLMLIGVLPTWPHSANWGYYPSGGLGIVVIVVLVLLLLGRI